MEISGVVQGIRKETPKRPLENDDLSPSSKQEEKQQKKMPSLEEKIDMLLASMQENSAEIKDMNQRLKNLEDMQKELSEMKNVQQKMQISIDNVTERICQAEREIKVVRQTEKEAPENFNDQLTIRNLPSEVKDNKDAMNAAISKILDVLDISIDPCEYEAYATKTAKKNIVDITMKCSTPWLKTRIIKKFREKRSEPLLLVERIIDIPEDHELNGIELKIANKLPPHKAKLLNYARKFVPSHFSFAYDTPEGDTMVKTADKFQRISNNEDVDILVQQVGETKKSAKKPEKISVPSFNPATTRAATRRNQMSNEIFQPPQTKC